VFLVLRAFTPPADPSWRLCPFHWLTGLDCPLCGLTRGLFALAKFQVADAVRFNALTPLAAAMLLSLLGRGPWTGRFWTAGAIAFAAYGVWRVSI
jgi:hypothetical protein